MSSLITTIQIQIDEERIIADLTEKTKNFQADFNYKDTSAWLLDILSAANDSSSWAMLNTAQRCEAIDVSRVAIELVHELPVLLGDVCISIEEFRKNLALFDVYSPQVVADVILKILAFAMASQTAELWEREDRLKAVNLCRHLTGIISLFIPQTIEKEY